MHGPGHERRVSSALLILQYVRTVHRLVAALGFLQLCSPHHQTLHGLAVALEAAANLEKKRSSLSSRGAEAVKLLDDVVVVARSE